MDVYNIIKEKFQTSKIAQDSIWSVLGNAISLFILLLCGIIIARVVGKEVYGQYGTIKNLMTAFASLAAFGLGYTSTKVISHRVSIVRGFSIKAIRMVALICLIICLLLVGISEPVALFMNKPELHLYFNYIAILMSLKAVWTVANGILAGYKLFKQMSLNNIISSILMLIVVYPLTSLYGLIGAVISLMLYQLVDAILCIVCIMKIEKKSISCDKVSYWEIFKFTFPIALHEMSFTMSSIAYVMIILRYSNYGEYGLYTIAAQWNAIIIIIPTLLMNVTLSYLSNKTDVNTHEGLVKKMLLLNICCTMIPFLIILLFSPLITNLYGDTFHGLTIVLNVCVFSTLFASLVLVFQSNLISEGRNWNLAIYKVGKEIISIFLLFYVLKKFSHNGALLTVSVDLFMWILYCLILLADYIFYKRKRFSMDENV